MSQREDLLAGAKKCLIEKGYSKTTARDIAAASGAHLASIGYHFGSKDNLMNTAVIEATSEWGNVFDRAVRETATGSPEERIRLLVTVLFESIPEQRDLMVAGVEAYAQSPFNEDIRTALTEGHQEARRELAALILDVPSDQVDPGTVAGLGSMIYNIVTGYVQQYIVDPDSLPTVDQAMEGLRALVSPGA
ncbi:TetR/AcrR family transcriptional regulator [Nocardiopsis exhalans]|uniref:TetR/AcrR family transcriptional regulator n=1 Tax=Nocardiopsis exhalans TaxID=163604 RepID=A0ABY5D7H6_9ACTN|nr:TetR/AcrR family transcriptional regulator [Nocardiopsis exhalans]USY19239.1 TetR/AcrR family transcriptional regulator [Nocardiopsis exhalans]